MTNSSGGVVPTAETSSHSPERSGGVDGWGPHPPKRCDECNRCHRRHGDHLPPHSIPPLSGHTYPLDVCRLSYFAATGLCELLEPQVGARSRRADTSDP